MANNIQTRTIQINGVDVKYKVTNNLKKIQVLFNDNFATAGRLFKFPFLAFKFVVLQRVPWQQKTTYLRTCKPIL